MSALYGKLRDEGLLEYGGHIPGPYVRAFLGIEMPVIGTKRDFDAASLAELSAMDQVREALLGEGKYLAGSGDGYRILTPAENGAQVDRYLGQAQNKIRRARKLERTSPPMSDGQPSQLAARLMMADSGARRRFGFDEEARG